MSRTFILASFGLALFGTAMANTAHAASRLSATDRAWIATCVAQRKETKIPPAALRNYCVCMHDVVEDNQPFGITELERAYPPVHELCSAKHRAR